MAHSPDASVVVPARNEADYLPATLSSLRAMRTDREWELVVVDGDSDDATPTVAREFGATVIEGPGESIGHGRHLGAEAAAGEWLAFVDADTTVRADYLGRMLTFVEREGLAAASSRCRMDGWRSVPMRATVNRLFPRLGRPILPGFNVVIERSAYFEADGFPSVPNEDTAFSRRLAREYPTGYHPEALVETSARRIRSQGLTGTLVHYLALDWRRLRAEY
jgi:glycosyltransferase involved in cell wall biosynthesis